MPISDALVATLAVTSVLEELAIPYLIAGSLASSYHGILRSTADADLVAARGVEPPANQENITMAKNAKKQTRMGKTRTSANTSTKLPDTARWLPRQAATTLAGAFSKRCASGEEHLRRVLAQEQALAVDNFDSGVPF